MSSATRKKLIFAVHACGFRKFAGPRVFQEQLGVGSSGIGHNAFGVDPNLPRERALKLGIVRGLDHVEFDQGREKGIDRLTRPDRIVEVKDGRRPKPLGDQRFG